MPRVVKPDELNPAPHTIHSIAVRFARATINTRLIAIVLTLAVPLNLVVVVVIWRLASVADEMQRMSLLYAARSIATAVDAELGKYIALGQVLSQDPALLEDSLETFDHQLRSKLISVPNAWAVVGDVEGRRLLSTAVPRGQPLPPRPAEGLAAQDLAFKTRSAVISDIFQGPKTHVWMASATIPIFRDGEPFRALALAMKVRHFVDLLSFRDMPRSWRASIRDANARLIARVPDNDRWVGRPASEPFRAINDQNGLFHIMSVDGEELLIANKRSDLSGWTISIAAKTAELRAATFSTIGWAIALGGTISLLSLIFAIWIARRITRPLAELRQNADAVLADPQIRFDPGVPELGELWAALRRAAANQLLLMRELNHRTKNLLSVVQSIANQTAASKPTDFVERFSRRIQALSASHDLLVQGEWRGVEIEALVRAQLAHFSDLIGERIVIDGSPLSVTPTAAQSIGMALHELATNAGKYGSLSDDHGSVTIDWRIERGQFTIGWVERGGPSVKPPKRRGFGSTIISAVAESSVGGEVELKYESTGVIWRLRCAASKVLSAGCDANTEAQMKHSACTDIR
jgi:two-component sensor histidine kinase